MLGMIFTEALDFIDEQVGVVGLEEILLKSDLADGVAFTAVGNYGHEQLVDVVSAAVEHTGIPADDLMRAFGSWMFPHLVEAHDHAKELAQKGLREFLLGIHSQIHSTVISLYDAADPPSVLAEERGGTIVVEYRSHRPFAAVAQGLLEGCCEYFGGTHAVCARSAPHSDGGMATFEVAPRQTAQK
jgi:hypothetical protein